MPDQTLPQEKTCAECGETKPRSEFHRHSARKDGLNSYCKECAIARSREWYASNKGRAGEWGRRYREENAERKREVDHRWYRQNRKRAIAAAKRWREENPQRVAAHAKQRYENNPKVKARLALGKAVEGGKLVKPGRCENCDELTDSCRLHGHHEDYSKPLDVEWLCQDCHLRRHGGEPLSDG